MSFIIDRKDMSFTTVSDLVVFILTFLHGFIKFTYLLSIYMSLYTYKTVTKDFGKDTLHSNEGFT